MVRKFDTGALQTIHADMNSRCQYISVGHRRGIHEPHATRLYNEQDEFHQPSTKEQVSVSAQT